MALTAAVRNLGALLRIVLLLAAVAIATIGAHTLLARANTTLDVTATGDHRLSPRTLDLLARLPGEFELVLSADTRSIDARVRRRVEDVLDAFARANARLRVTTIDIGSGTGQVRAGELLDRIADREANVVESSAASIAAAGGALRALATDLTDLSAQLGRVRAALPPEIASTNGAFFEQRAAVLRVLAREAGAIDETAPLSGAFAPRVGALEDAGERIIDQAASLSGELRRLAALPEVARDAGPPVRAASDAADAITASAERTLASLAGVREPDAARARRVLETGPALLVVGPPGAGLGAVAAGDLFVPADTLDRAGLSAQALAGPRAEALIADAIGVVVDPVRPVVVIAHAELRSGLLEGPLLRLLRARLAEQGIATTEWAVVEDPLPPSVAVENERTPIVTIVIAPDTAAGSASDPETAGPRRAERLAQALAPLLARGEPMLLSLAPSVFPTYGEPDPLAQLASPFGIAASTGRPLLSPGEDATTGSDVEPVAGGGDHPIASAIEGLPLRVPWGVPIVVGEGASALFTLGDETRAWAERDWLRFWGTPANQRALLRDAPVFDAATDTPGAGMALAAAGVRTTLGREQRLVVVGSNSWLLDPIAQRAEQRGGRLVPTHPGNAELLDASINWLAGLDDRLAPSARARAIPLIRPLDHDQLGVLRWALIAGVPAGVLLVGLGVRLVIR